MKNIKVEKRQIKALSEKLEKITGKTVEVSNVSVTGKIVTVDVNLPRDEGLGDAFSYPKAAIKFDKKPLIVRVNFE